MIDREMCGCDVDVEVCVCMCAPKCDDSRAINACVAMI